ncbi:Fanconi anemia group A protein isoform X1 [Micropterus salmoides]|uniref:Fanconi anemia group A protein isoform X1 n=2 Tax=Micropterus salmoides TaxID=27706 RepID=UPI0018EE444D|nr:Fanconi anemia group A protein isoform X1 [Micropterus salmoides]
MSLSASCESVSQKRTLSSLLAGRVVKRPKQGDGQHLHEATIQLLEQQQNICSLLREVQNPDLCNIFCSHNGEQKQAESEGISSAITGSLLGDLWKWSLLTTGVPHGDNLTLTQSNCCELQDVLYCLWPAGGLRRQASHLGVPVAVLSVKMVLDRLMEITGTEEVKEEEDKRRELLTSSQRVQLCVLLESSKELLSQGALCPKVLWQEYRRDQRLPKLEVVYHLHFYNILTLKYILESDEGVRLWLVSQLKALCGWTPPQGEEETKQVQQQVLSTVASVLVGTGFELSHEPAAADRRISLLCSSVLDDMLFWLLDTVEKTVTLQSAGTGAKLWIQIFDVSLCGVSVSGDALQRFFTHCLTQTLTYKPRLTVSDAITLQNEWTFAKASRLLTSVFCKLAVIFSVEQLLCHLQQVLETHEVNWKHVLCFLSTLLVYNPCAQPSVRELLSRLLSSAFEGYDLENMITAFLLARQGALEGPGIFPSYSDWFKMSFGGCSGYHAANKKSLVFLLKFLSDLVPFEPPQYLKVHILHPPYVPVKHRSLLMEYVSLAKTRLADLKESMEDMGLYEDVSGAGGASVQPQCQAVQDVEKAVSLFESTGRISATVMEASIFRRPYFLTRFLPALLTSRVLPVKADARMSFIEALKKADKIPAAQYSSYVESCQKQRQQDRSMVCSDTHDDPLEVLKIQLQEFTELLVGGNDGEMSAQLSRISYTLSVIFPGGPNDLIGQTVISLHINTPLSPELHVKAVNMILRNFCQCLLDASRTNPPNKQSLWASRFVSVLLGNTPLLSSLMHRLWDLFHNQWSSLSPAHLLGLGAFVVHLHASTSHGPLVQLIPPILPKPVPIGEALSSALFCSTHTNMLFCVRLCVAAVCYGICRGDSQQQQQDYIVSSLYKKLLYLIPRLLPEARRTPITAAGPVSESQEENLAGLWSSTTDTSSTWRKTAWYLWRHPAFCQLEHTPQYKLLFSDWLANELRVQRSEDALSDPERQEYQQWACLELYLPRPEEQGGCGGDMKSLCSHLLNAIMNQQLSSQSLEKLDYRVSETGTCLPDILSRLQEFVYEMEVTDLSGSRGSRADVCDFLFELVSEKCSSTATSASPSISIELSLEHTLNTWNRVLLALPAVLLIKVKAEGGRMTLECNNLIEHVNQHQRKVCSPAGLLSCHLTAHLLKGVLCASVRCGRSGEEVNKAWSQISLRCPLLLVSTVHWWERLSPVLLSLWHRLCDGEPVPEQLQRLTDSQNWACSLRRGLPSSPVPAAAALVLAASLHRAWRGCGCDNQDFSTALKMLQPEKGIQYRQVLVFLLFLCVSDHLSGLLYPQEKSHQKARTLCNDLLPLLVDSGDWLLIFKSNEQGVYQSITMVTSDECTRLMPWAFYSLVLQQSAELLQRAMCCPGFLHTAVLCYISLLQLFLEGYTLAPENQMEPFQILSHSKQFLLRAISQTPPAALSSSQLRQLESQYTDLDPEVAAALSVHLDPHSLSPEMDFL